jgi:tubulin--tyrosine ligase
MTSQLRHFVAQPYIDPPLLMPSDHPSAGRKFHIRTYVLAVGALKVFVYKPMLALFAGKPYSPPSSEETSPDLSAHLTNTCLQTGEREGSVHAFWSLPSTLPNLPADWREVVFKQICESTGQVFEAAARSMSIHFQPLPNAFELFGLDFMVDAEGTTWLMEVNAFPDFAQTGDELQDLVKNLMEDVADVAIKPFFGVKDKAESAKEGNGLVEVLDIDLGKH